MKQPTFHKILLLIIISLACTINTNAQISDAFAQIADSTGEKNIFTVVVNDTTNISDIEVKLGEDLGTGELKTVTFIYDASVSKPLIYSRIGQVIQLNIGNVAKKYLYYGQARLKYTNGTWSQPFQFLTN